MTTKLNLLSAAFVFTLAFSAFSSESTQAGRYRVEGPSNATPSTAQAGRYKVSSDFAFAPAGAQDSSQNLVAGRYSRSQLGEAAVGIAVSNRMMTERAQATDVSNKPAIHDHK